jgi:hypothetical protein
MADNQRGDGRGDTADLGRHLRGIWITNVVSEETIRVIRAVARDAYGLRNPVRQRAGAATIRWARGHLNPR